MFRERNPTRQLARTYLKKSPFYGISSWQDSTLLGRKPGGAGALFDGHRKQFYANDEKVLESLLRTGKWTPMHKASVVNVPLLLELIEEKKPYRDFTPASISTR